MKPDLRLLSSVVNPRSQPSQKASTKEDSLAYEEDKRGNIGGLKSYPSLRKT